MTEHGTPAGYRAHHRRGERPCDTCREARRIYMRQWRKARASGRAFNYPLELTARTWPLDAVGVTLARSFRESA